MMISIVIPCYNQGHFLQDVLESIHSIDTSYEYEIIIVNDGSTDASTKEALEAINKEEIKVIHQPNLGLATARNNGIQQAKGKYILPLDADNKLHANSLTKAIDILEQGKYDVVYGNKQLFGDEENFINVGGFDTDRLLHGNYIDACAVFKKSVWEKAGGYDAGMPSMGNEDWEFWVNAMLHGCNFYYLNELSFYYRVTGNSMRLNVTNPAFDANKQYIIQKHAAYFYSFYNANYRRLNYLKAHRIKAGINLILGRLGV